MKVDQTIKNK